MGSVRIEPFLRREHGYLYTMRLGLHYHTVIAPIRLKCGYNSDPRHMDTD